MEHIADKQYVTMAWLLGAAVTDPQPHHWRVQAQHCSTGAATPVSSIPILPSQQQLPLLARLVERLRSRRGISWQLLLAAAALGVNAVALALLLRRAYSSARERRERQRAEEEQQEVTRVALAYLQRLWDVAVQVRVVQESMLVGVKRLSM